MSASSYRSLSSMSRTSKWMCAHLRARHYFYIRVISFTFVMKIFLVLVLVWKVWKFCHFGFLFLRIGNFRYWSRKIWKFLWNFRFWQFFYTKNENLSPKIRKKIIIDLIRLDQSWLILLNICLWSPFFSPWLPANKFQIFLKKIFLKPIHFKIHPPLYPFSSCPHNCK